MNAPLGDAFSDEQLKKLSVNRPAPARPQTARLAPRRMPTPPPPGEPFHNPYQFIPTGVHDSEHSVPLEEFSKRSRDRDKYSLSHAIYRGKSGRLLCRLSTKTPIFVGAESSESDEDNPSLVQPSIDLDGNPMIPASTLRGLISGLAEAASASSLRILDNRTLSYRQPADARHALDAIGMLIEYNGSWRLRPLTVPRSDRADAVRDLFPKQLDRRLTQCIKVKCGDYAGLEWLKTVTTFESGTLKHYYLRLSDIESLPENRGYRVKSTDCLLPEPPKDDEKCVRGVLYILKTDSSPDLPTTRVHELFIPFPDGVESRPTLPVSKGAIETFNALAEELYDDEGVEGSPATRPYIPKGRTPNQKAVQLRDGDLVYYQLGDMGSHAEVTTVSFSSVWRGTSEVNGRPARVYDYFGGVDPELLPMGASGRKKVTPAELLFGFVEEGKKSEKDKSKESLAYASRIRFSDARTDGRPDNPYESYVILKILAAPKPPSPALYFKPRDMSGDGYISKSELDPISYEPMGRKVYLHKGNNPNAWETKCTQGDTRRYKQKVKIAPWRAGLEFYFHIDFDNLSDWEIGLLSYAIRPSEAHRHKLGMGKPLGLGTVQIDPVGLFFIGRDKRYRDEDPLESKGRYHTIMLKADEDREKWPRKRYETEYHESQCKPERIPNEKWLPHLHGSFKPAGSAIRQAIELLGDPANVQKPVHYPQVCDKRSGTCDFEEEHYVWFVDNDQQHHQPMAPITEDTHELPALVKSRQRTPVTQGRGRPPRQGRR